MKLKRKHKRRIIKLFSNTTKYKVYNIRLRLFSDGGKTPTFSEDGRTYSTLGNVRRHLAQVETEDFKNLIVIEYRFKAKDIKLVE